MSANIPTKKELKIATIIAENVKEFSFCKSKAPRNPAPKTIGIESKNENFADFFGETPKNKDATIVNPDLEIPGIIANACTKPIIKE